MKTSELKRIVEENGYEFQKTNQSIFIRLNDFKIMGLDLHDHTVVLYEGVSLRTNQIKRNMVALIQYSNTPISEREDEKKYCLEIAIHTGVAKFVNKNKETGGFSILTIQEDERYKTLFTQSEIDNFPSEIKGAIECGFLRKVEVE
jgi:hypothetical protein